jgi:hypothetical protein
MCLVKFLDIISLAIIIMIEDTDAAEVHKTLHHDNNVRSVQINFVARSYHIGEEIYRHPAI